MLVDIKAALDCDIQTDCIEDGLALVISEEPMCHSAAERGLISIINGRKGKKEKS